MATVDFDSESAQSYIFYSTVLAVKMLLVAFAVGYTRSKKKVLANPEDLLLEGSKVKFDDPDVERLRRAHLNDLENIPVFWLLGALYLTTSPVAATAKLLFRVFAAVRIFHTYVYTVKILPQPSRFLCFVISSIVNLYLALQILLYYASGL